MSGTVGDKDLDRVGTKPTASLSGGWEPVRAESASARLYEILGGAGRTLLLSSEVDGPHARQLSAHALDYATNALLREQPEFSAAQVVTAGQYRAFVLLFLAMLTIIGFCPRFGSLLVTSAVAAGYLANAVFRAWLFWVGADESTAASANVPNVIPLPIYTVLVPLYREANVLPHLASALRRISGIMAQTPLRLAA